MRNPIKNKKRRRRRGLPTTAPFLLAAELLEPRRLLAADPIISEFLARNDGGLRDGNGRSSDWVEIFNAGDLPVDLAGYRLTDNPNNLSKWVFPSTALEPGDHLVVFASGQDAGPPVDSAGNLHTNFTLKRGGEYIGLVSPDGIVVSEYGSRDADFPEQLPNVSFGIAQSTTLVDAGSRAAYRVPTDDSLGLAWTAPDFDAVGNGFALDSAALGFESRPDQTTNFVGHFQTALPDRTHAVYSRIEFAVNDASLVTDLTLSLKYDNGFVAYLNGVEVARANAPDRLAWFSMAPDASPRDTEAVEFVDFDLSRFTSALVDGTNVLALHGLNNFSDDTDMLLVPKLVAGARDAARAFGHSVKVGYMATPTPGAPNVASSDVRSGFVSDTAFSVDRGFYEQPFPLEITTDTNDADIFYTTDGSEPGPENPSATRYVTPVAIRSTTILRAAAYKPDFLPTNVDTQTYLFADDVIRQDPIVGEKYPATWQSAQYTGDYQMDPDVVAGWDDNDPNNSDYGIREALKSLPTISIVLDHEDLWGQRTGIYNHATNTGEAWRRPGSVEYFDVATGDEFQVDAGIQIHGGASRDNLRTKKHSFRLLFRGDFGPTTLDFPLFEGAHIEGINTVVLKSFFTDGFPTRTVQGRYSPLDSQYLRDTWMRDSQLAMGNLSAHSEYAHLYINGLYWGLYSPTERPDEDFLAGYLGGDPEDFDIVKDFNELFAGDKTAWNRMFALANQGLASDAAYQRIQGNRPDGTPDPDLPNYLDVDNLIDYMILHLYAGAEDWPHHNWYAGRDRVNDTKGFQFYSWDQEIVLDGFFRDRTEVNDDFSPARLYHNLRENAEFRLRFADRVHQHLFQDGALTVEASQQRWMRRADQIEQAIVTESARWGDAREGETGEGGVRVPTMTIDQWRIERDNVRDNYFPASHQRTLQRFIQDGLYPEIEAPTFNQHGGVVPRSFAVQMTAPRGVIYFTRDGSDPRQWGGAISPSATKYTEPINLAAETTFKARAFHDGEWSALTETHFQLASEVPLRVTEINFHPHEANPVSGLGERDVDRDQFEFVELMNVGEASIDLAGVRFVDQEVPGEGQGIRFTFGPQMLEPGGRIVVARDRDAFQSRYGRGIRLADGGDGVYEGSLANDGARLALLDAGGRIIQEFSYGTSDAWPGRAQGYGSSLQIIDTSASYSSPANWQSSIRFGGSPGSDDGRAEPSVVINEVLANSQLPDVDRLELHNRTAEDVDISGWYVSDSEADYFQSQIAATTTVSAGGYAVLSQDQLGIDFDGARGDQVWLVAADGEGRPSRFIDHIQFGPTPAGVSVGPGPEGDGRWVSLAEPTFGGANAGHLVGDVVFSEIHYQPVDPDGERSLNANDFEFIELYNRAGRPIDLAGWQLSGAVEFVFPSGTVVDAGQSMLVVGFDSTIRPTTRVLRFTYGISDQIPVVGPYSQPLDDDRGVIRLLRPGTPSPTEPGATPPILVDQARYDHVTPWPTGPAGGGDSLTRKRPEDYGAFASSWIARTPSPGAVDFLVRLPGDSNEDGRFDQLDIVAALQGGKYRTGDFANWFEGDWNGDGRFDQSDIVTALQRNGYSPGPGTSLAPVAALAPTGPEGRQLVAPSGRAGSSRPAPR